MNGTKKGLGAMRNIKIYCLVLGGTTGAPLFVPMFGASRPIELRGDDWLGLNLAEKEIEHVPLVMASKLKTRSG